MNYEKFYTAAENRLIDSMVSMWFKGKAKEQEYMRSVLTEEEHLLSEPVFQSIFPWEDSKETFGEHASKLNILTPSFVKALSSESVDENLRFPLDRHPYKHQTKSWKTMLSEKRKTIVVTSGTGSGKTECFMIPVLQDIVKNNEKNCVQAIFLYPLNALMKSQQKRIHAWCNAMPEKITYAIYNGDTEKSVKSSNHTTPYYPELITRPQIRETPPQILFTNPTMLNYMLVRAEDKSILEKSKGKLKWILLDEAHTYTGSSAAELSLQLRRVLDAFSVSIEQVNFAVTSATIGDEKDPATELKLKTFVSQLTGKPVDNIVVISGKRIIPEIDEEKATVAINQINEKFDTEISIQDIQKLRKKLNSNPVLATKNIANQISKELSKNTTKSLELIDFLGNKIEGLNKTDGSSAALLPTRAHFFIRSISGVYVCINPECKRHKEKRLPIGSLTTYQNTNCPICKSRMLEVANCSSCGGTIIIGETSTSEGFRMHINAIDLDNNLFYDTNEDLIETDEQPAESGFKAVEKSGYTPFYIAKPENKCLRRNTSEDNHRFNHKKGNMEIAADNANKEATYQSLRHSETNISLCPHCGNNLGKLNYMRASATQMGRVLSTLILDHAEPGNTSDADILYEGRKYIAFTDNRQGSARSAMGLNQDVERSWIRSTIFHKLADIRLESIKQGGLTPEEEAQYTVYKSMGNGLPPILKTELNKLESKKTGNPIIPPPQEVSWNEISQTLENNSDFRKLFKHLSNARSGYKYDNPNIYLKALLVDQFGWIPKRANSLETMGFVRLSYPDLQKAKCPSLLIDKGCKNKDWQDFLKICLDYFIRGARHYMTSGEYKDYLTQNTYTSAIYPKDSELRKNGHPISKWPTMQKGVKGVQEDQSRLVLLLCAVLGYNDVESFNQEKEANINSLLTEAWSFITENILEPVDVDNKGFMLDLIGSKVKLQLIETGYLCPVDNVIVDVTFCGYSPRINGYIGMSNFERFKVQKEFKYPYYPFKSVDQTEEDLEKWMHENLNEQKEAGAFSNIHERVYAQKNIFISAEHSAQQSREDLDRYEKEFNDGHLNILSCSTTMEMGVDIGGINEVVMNNVPPKSANYLQRAGRAGRRNESKALALTFCAPNPIGLHTFNHPEYPITHITETPLLKLESRQLIQRHINALVFAAFVSHQGGIRVTAQLKDFFVSTNEVPYYDLFLNYIDKIIGGQENKLEEPYARLVKGTGLEFIPIEEAVYKTKKNISAVQEVFKTHMDSLNKSLENLNQKEGHTAATRAIDRQKENFLKTSLLSYLAENTYLPSAGIPTGLVECVLGSKDNTNYPTMHLSQAISAYSPGSQVVKNEWIYEPKGIRLKTKYDDNTSRYILQNCINCSYTTINYGSATNDCPKCGQQSTMRGIKDMSTSSDSRFTEVVEPAAFTVAWGDKPTRKTTIGGAMNFIQPILLEMDPWTNKTSSAKITTRCSTPRSEILFYNRGRNGFGYAFCPYCGKMELEQSMDAAKPAMVNHKNLTTGAQCFGNKSGNSSIRRHILLVGRYQTDFIEIKFYNGESRLETDSETLYSLGVILSRKLTELLGINDGELDFGYNGESHSIFIYDTALGGAGYSPLFREYKDLVMKMAYDSLKSCDCERSCTKCLIDRKSQWYLNYLNKEKAIKWLEIEQKSRTAPESITSEVPDAVGVTSDFATEIYQLFRYKNIKSIKVFIDSNYSTWQPSEFPYSRLMSEQNLEGVNVSFVLDKPINLKECSSPVRTVIMSALFQNKFSYYKDSTLRLLKPLLSVTFNDETTKTYFGEKVDTSLSFSWGNGDIYSTISNCHLDYSDIDTIQLMEQIEDGDHSMMFDTRIKEDCLMSTVLSSLTKENVDKWGKIKTHLNEKSVSLEYSDRYLITPLGCMLLAHLIAEIKNLYNLSITSINLYTVKIANSNLSADNPVNVCSNFECHASRNQFLKDALNEIVGVCPIINESGYIEHERCLTIRSNTGELSIRPDAGIANGWKPFGRENAACTDSYFRNDWKLDMNLYNQKKKHAGILYTISYKQIER